MGYWRRAEEGIIHYAAGARLELEVGVGVGGVGGVGVGDS